MGVRTFLFAFVALASAFTKPTNQTLGALLLPDVDHPVTAGKTFNIVWENGDYPIKGNTVSLVLCRGPSTDCELDDKAIVEGVRMRKKHYEWHVPASLPPGKKDTKTGYGMLIIEDGTGDFQYSTQFSVLANTASGGKWNVEHVE